MALPPCFCTVRRQGTPLPAGAGRAGAGWQLPLTDVVAADLQCLVLAHEEANLVALLQGDVSSVGTGRVRQGHLEASSTRVCGRVGGRVRA